MNEENKEKVRSNVCLIKDCNRLIHKESKYCIFHTGAEEKTEEEFKKALKEYVDKTKKEDNDYHFEKFIFVGDINFKEDFDIEIFKNASFFEAIFEGDVNFTGINFDGDTYFISTIFKKTTFFTGVTFEGNSVFIKTTFHGDANFTTTTFNGEADFKSTNFESFTRFNFLKFNGVADFREATFKMNTEFKNTSFMSIANFEVVKFNGHFSKFMNTTFIDNANFFVVKFKGNADFRGVTFNHDANFEEATFENDVDFRCKYFFKDLNFSKIETLPGKKIFFRMNNKEGKIYFNRAYLENTYLDLELTEGLLIDFSNALLRNTKIKKFQIENHISQEKEGQFLKAMEVYLLLKNNFHSIGRYNDESWAFTKERDMEKSSKSFYSLINKYKKYGLFKKILKKGNLLKRVIVKSKIFSKWLFSKKAFEWFNLSVSDYIYQYGENPKRVIRFALIIIFLFAIILNFSGIINSDRSNLIIEIIKENQGDGYTLRYFGPILGSFLNCLYFSVVTFTTLGYGDFQPAVGASRFFVSLESIIGAITMALFVYTFARRTGGR